MKKRITMLAIVLAMLFAVSCAKEAPQAPTEEETTTTVATGEEVGKEGSLPTEEELGITHPIRLASDMRIVAAEDELEMKSYTVKTSYDETHDLILGEPIARGILSATLGEIKKDGTKGSYDMVGVGYYDLEAAKFVQIADLDPEKRESETTVLFPYDEGRFVREKIKDNEVSYSVYTIADGSMEDFARIQVDGEISYGKRPVVTDDKIYIGVVYDEGTKSATYVFDRATMKELEVKEGIFDARPWKDGLVTMSKGDPEKSVVEMTVGEEKFTWADKDRRYISGFGVGTDPAGIYVLTTDYKSDALEDDLTELERKKSSEYPYFELRDWSTGEGKVLAAQRGSTMMTLSVSDSWIGLSRMAERAEGEFRYLLIPGENKAVRIATDHGSDAVELLPYAKYGIIKEPWQVSLDRVVYTIEPKDKAQ